MVTGDRGRAKALGYLLHLVAGEGFALVYYAIFTAIDTSGWAPGALFGLLHGIVSSTALVNILLPVIHPRMGSALSAADSGPLLEPPGFLTAQLRSRRPPSPPFSPTSRTARSYGGLRLDRRVTGSSLGGGWALMPIATAWPPGDDRAMASVRDQASQPRSR